MSDDQIALSSASYGKSAVRLVKVQRDGPRHGLRDLSVDVALEGDFAACYERGDNRAMPATDTMRNIIYATAHADPIASLEGFGLALARRLLAAGPTVSRARVRIVEHGWARLGPAPGHEHAFVREAGEATASLSVGPEGVSVAAGLDGLTVLKTTASGWSDFHRDQFTTLPDADDRILATVLSAEWSYGAREELDFAGLRAAVRARLLERFADHYSPSVQHTLYLMGRAVLEEFPAVERIHIAMPNKHHLPFNLAPFGIESRGEIFHATSEPYGLIEATLERRG